MNLRAELTNAATLPYGPARSAALEALVEAADASGDDALARDVRLQLVSSYGHGGEPLKRFVPFSWLLERYDKDPASFDSSTRWSLLWMFKWVSVGALSHPAVPLETIRRGLADMEDRYRAVGEGLAPYYGCQVRVEAHVNGHAQAEEAYLAWTRAPGTHLSDCEQCEPTYRVMHLAATSRHAEAVGESMSVLHESTWCLEQPHSIIAHSLESMLVVGEATRAAREHVRGVRLIRGKPGNTGLWAQHILILARTGRLSRGLDLLEDHLHEVDDAPTPQDAMYLAAAGARLLRALANQGRADLPVTTRAGTKQSEPASASEVEQRLGRVARDIATRFDARNHTGTVSAEVEQWLDAPDLPDLPLDEVVSRYGLATTPARMNGLALPVASPIPVPPSTPSLVPLDAEGGQQVLAEIDATFQLSQHTGSKQQRTAALNRWRTLRESLPPPVDAAERVAAAELDAAAAIEHLGDEDVAALPTATARLRELGQHALAVRYDLFDLRHRHQHGLDGGATIRSELDALLAEADAYCTPADRGCLALPTVDILGSADAEDSGSAAAGQERRLAILNAGIELLQQDDVHLLTAYQRSGLVGLLLNRLWMEQPADPIAVLRSALALLPSGWRAHQRAIVGMNLAGQLAAIGDIPEARTLLEDVTKDALIAGEPRLSAEVFGMLGRVHNHTGDAAAAVTAFSSARQLLEGSGSPERIAELTHELVHALRAAGRTPEAAELAETTLQILIEQTRLDDVQAGPEKPAETPSNPDAVVAGSAAPVAKDPGTASMSAAAGTSAAPENGAAAQVAAGLAFAGALAAWDLGEDTHACALARRSATWYRSTGSTAAQAQSLTLAGEIESDPVESGKLFTEAVDLYVDADLWRQAARCRRLLAGSVHSVDGLESARESLSAARSALEAYLPQDGEEIAYATEKLALTVQTARILADGGSLDEALAVLDGVDQAYRDMGDPGSARWVVGLQVDILIQLGQAEEALRRQTRIAEEAREAGEIDEARRRGADLTRILDNLGRSDEAETAWQRFRS